MQIIILNQLLRTTGHLFMFLVTIGLLCCTGIEHAQDSGENPLRPLTKIKVKQIFERLTRNLPSRIHIIVKSKVISEPVGEKEIWADPEQTPNE